MNEEELSRKLLKLLEQKQPKFNLEENQLKIVKSDRAQETLNLPPQLKNQEILILHEKRFNKKRRQSGIRLTSLVFELKIMGKV